MDQTSWTHPSQFDDSPVTGVTCVVTLAHRVLGGARFIYMGGRITMHSRMLRHRVVTGAVTLALALGGVAVTGGAASAAGASADRASTSECQQARKDLSKAKKQLRKAKKSDKAAKVRKAKKKLRAAKQNKSRICSAPAPVTEESVLEQVQQGQLALDNLDLNSLTGALPPELGAALGQLVDQLQGALDGIGAGVPGADTAQLEALLAALQAMDAQGVASALQGLLGSLTEIGGGPEALDTLLALFQGGLPGGGDLPIAGLNDLQALLGQLTAQLGGLGGGLDPVGAPAQVQAAIAQLVATLEGLTGNIGGDSAPGLGALTELVNQLGALGALVPGGAGSADVLGQVLATMLGFLPAGTDPVSTLTDILSGGGLAGVLELIGLGNLLGGLLGGGLGGLLGTPAA